MSQFYTVSWFSAGVSSAVATRLAIDSYGVDEIIYIDIEDQHPDSMRFVKDCEHWFGRPITILRSPYGTVERACRAAGWINGPRGAACTRLLKKRVRKEWERSNEHHNLRYVWGLDADEAARAERIADAMPQFEHLFPLLDHASGNGMGKAEAHAVLRASGIKRPAMYDLGYHNNNCIGCVKGGMGYWNKIRLDFPEVFAARAKLERIIGASCIKGVFLDELAADAGRHGGPIVDECGIFCEIIGIEPATERLTGGDRTMSELVNAKTRNVLYEDEFWVIRNCGPRMWSAHRKSDGEHRLYWSFESLERDFGRIEPSTEPADTTQPAVAQADADSSESGQ